MTMRFKNSDTVTALQRKRKMAQNMSNIDNKILLIEDNAIVRNSILDYLKYRGFSASGAEIGRTGLEMFRQDQPDLIMLDLRLPDIDGLDVLSTIVKESPDTPVIIISGAGNMGDAVKALQLGAWDYLIKPVDDMEIIFSTIQKMLDRTNLIQKNREYKENLHAIFKSIKDAIITVNKESIILELNESAAKICGFPDNAKGKEYESFTGGCSGECLAALNETINTKLSAEKSRFECSRQGHPRRVVSAVTYPLFYRQNDFSGCIMVLKDETKLVELEVDILERQQLQNIIGKSEKIQKVYAFIESLADVQTTVLITGENGTGKGLVAEALHYYKNSNKRPFVVVNCVALSENLLESELFGHVKGAFTGAVNDRIGRFQMADGGTIFLDEIGDISKTMQLRLLKVIQDKEFERVGDSIPVKVNVRIIAATNQDLRNKVRYGKFREDLYHRLKVAELIMPPLRERREDILLLSNHFMEDFNKKLNKNIKAISTDVQKIFMNYQWPGNIRELQNALESAFVQCDKAIITLDILPPDIQNTDTADTQPSERKRLYGRQAIIQALKETGGNKAKAARLLGIARKTIYLKIKEYDISETITH